MSRIEGFDEFIIKHNDNLSESKNDSKDDWLTKEIVDFLNSVCYRGTWNYDSDTKEVSFTGSVDLSDLKYQDTLEELPLKIKSVKGNMNFDGCTKLKTLKGFPESVGGYLAIRSCVSLITLEGCPKFIDSCFYATGCTSLKSLKGAPVTLDNSVTHIFEVYGCDLIPEIERELIKDFEIRNLWLRSGLDAEDFMVKYRGRIRGKKFGI